MKSKKKTATVNAEAEERAAQKAALIKWVNWIHDGPASGLRRQHQFSRTTQGWTPTKKSSGKAQPIDVNDELDDVEGLNRDELESLKFEQAPGGPPATVQLQADDEAEAWHGQWGKGLNTEPLSWPSEMGEELPRILKEELVEAARTFPNHTGLGWDRLHPKSIERLSDETVELLVMVPRKCEEDGEWPEAVALVIIDMLPKTDGGLPAYWAHAVLAKALGQSQKTLC